MRSFVHHAHLPRAERLVLRRGEGVDDLVFSLLAMVDVVLYLFIRGLDDWAVPTVEPAKTAVFIWKREPCWQSSVCVGIHTQKRGNETTGIGQLLKYNLVSSHRENASSPGEASTVRRAHLLHSLQGRHVGGKVLEHGRPASKDHVSSDKSLRNVSPWRERTRTVNRFHQQDTQKRGELISARPRQEED